MLTTTFFFWFWEFTFIGEEDNLICHSCEADCCVTIDILRCSSVFIWHSCREGCCLFFVESLVCDPHNEHTFVVSEFIVFYVYAKMVQLNYLSFYRTIANFWQTNNLVLSFSEVSIRNNMIEIQMKRVLLFHEASL